MRSVEIQIGHHVRSGYGQVSHIQIQHGVDGDQQVIFIHGVAPLFGKVKDGSQDQQQAEKRRE
jgi:hypothetical protein